MLAGNEDIQHVRMQLARSMEECDALRAHLRSEQHERQVLENKVSDLFSKLVEAKNELQKTSMALSQVQNAMQKLLSNRDQRELQLQSSQDKVGQQERKIVELETRCIDFQTTIEQKKTEKTHLEKRCQELQDKINSLENEVGDCHSQIAAIKREKNRIIEEKADVEYNLEAKKKRITVLEEQLKQAAERESQHQNQQQMNFLYPSSIDMMSLSRAGTANNGSRYPGGHHGQNTGNSHHPYGAGPPGTAGYGGGPMGYFSSPPPTANHIQSSNVGNMDSMFDANGGGLFAPGSLITPFSGNGTNSRPQSVPMQLPGSPSHYPQQPPQHSQNSFQSHQNQFPFMDQPGSPSHGGPLPNHLQAPPSYSVQTVQQHQPPYQQQQQSAAGQYNNYSIYDQQQQQQYVGQQLQPSQSFGQPHQSSQQFGQSQQSSQQFGQQQLQQQSGPHGMQSPQHAQHQQNYHSQQPPQQQQQHSQQPQQQQYPGQGQYQPAPQQQPVQPQLSAEEKEKRAMQERMELLEKQIQAQQALMAFQQQQPQGGANGQQQQQQMKQFIDRVNALARPMSRGTPLPTVEETNLDNSTDGLMDFQPPQSIAPASAESYAPSTESGVVSAQTSTQNSTPAHVSPPVSTPAAAPIAAPLVTPVITPAPVTAVPAAPMLSQINSTDIFESMNMSSRPATVNDSVPTPSSIIATSRNGLGGSDPDSAASSTGVLLTAEEENTRQKIVEEMKEMKKDLINWHRDFVKANGREPTKQDRDVNVGPQFRKYRQVSLDLFLLAISVLKLSFFLHSTP